MFRRSVCETAVLVALFATLAPLSAARAQDVPAAPAQRIAAGKAIRLRRPTPVRFNLTEVARREARNPRSRRIKRIPDSGTTPSNFPVPGGLLEPSSGDSSPAEAFDTMGGMSPAPAQSFPALGDNGTVSPPDPTGAPGAGHVVTAINSEIRVQLRDAALTEVLRVSLDAFWADLPGSFDNLDTNGGSVPDYPDPFNPRLLYDTNNDADPANDRWVFVCAAETAPVGRQWSAVLLAVSRTNDPAGDWDRFRLDVDAPGDQQLWVDSPTLGFNGQWIVASLNAFDLGNNRFVRSQLYVFDKQALYPGQLDRFTRLNDATPSLVPAATYVSANQTPPGALYLVQNWNETSGLLRVSTINGPVGDESLAPGVAFPQALEGGWSFEPRNRADLAPQPGTTRRLQTGDARIQNVVYRNGSLWCAQTIFLPAGGNPTRASVRWVELEGAGADSLGIATRQEFRIDDPDATRFFAYPSIAVNAANDLLLGYSQFTGQEFASAGYAFRGGGDPLNTLRSATLLKSGEARYVRPIGTRNRWGGYSTSAVDPLDGSLWTLQTYAATPANRWGTWWGQIVPPERIAFVSSRGGFWAGNSEIYTMDADGTNQRRLTHSSGSDTNPAWSPDGTRIAFASERDGNNEIYVMRADGGDVTRVTANPLYDAEPDWSPDGRRIVFTRLASGYLARTDSY